MNVSSIFDLIRGTLGRVTNAVNTAQPVANDIVDKVGPLVETSKQLVDIGKGLFQGRDPTKEQIALVRKVQHDLAQGIADS